MATDVIDIVLWGRAIAAAAWSRATNAATFEYRPEFRGSGIEIAPLVMPLGSRIYTFPELSRETFRGLPGLLADSLPDRFGNLLIDIWLVRSGRDRESFSPLERLCYIGARGMGALEFQPALGTHLTESTPLEIASLVALANQALAEKESLATRIGRGGDAELEAMQDILRVGTSAGGARAKALIAWNPRTNEVRSGQVAAPPGFGSWLIKFDGISGNRDKELEDPQGYGRVEYAYHLMARRAGIQMAECRLHHENGRSHFMTKRFDRTDDGGKLLLQTLCALAHLDFNQAGAHGYEQAFQVAEQLGLGKAAREQLFRRMVFNVLARNQDDHTKNIAFLMDREGSWSLAPAYDVVYSFNPDGAWTHQHQMSVNGKTDGMDLADLRAVGRRFRVGGSGAIDTMVEETDGAVGQWAQFAAEARVPDETMRRIQAQHRRLGELRGNTS